MKKVLLAAVLLTAMGSVQAETVSFQCEAKKEALVDKSTGANIPGTDRRTIGNVVLTYDTETKRGQIMTYSRVYDIHFTIVQGTVLGGDRISNSGFDYWTVFLEPDAQADYGELRLFDDNKKLMKKATYYKCEKSF